MPRTILTLALLALPLIASAAPISTTLPGTPTGFNMAVVEPADLVSATRGCKDLLARSTFYPKYDADGLPAPAYASVRGPGCPEGLKVRFLRKPSEMKK